jgi:2'-5' RNA ligase
MSALRGAAYDRVWEAFQRSVATADGRHDTLAWRAHRGPYALCVVRIPAPALQPTLGVMRSALASVPGVRVHPDHFLHITLQELGFVVDGPARPDEISAARLEEFAQSAIDPVSRTPPFAIRLGGANAFEDAVFLEVGGGDPLAHIHQGLFDLAAIPRPPAYAYLPHCTVAHFDGTAIPQAAAAAIAPWRSERFGEVAVTEVEIVTLDPREPYPALDHFAAIPLGG